MFTVALQAASEKHGTTTTSIAAGEWATMRGEAVDDDSKGRRLPAS